jgi:hypothetical protein
MQRRRLIGPFAALARPARAAPERHVLCERSGQSACGVAGDAYNITTFGAVNTTRLRLNITSRAGLSTGVLEWMAFQS